MKLHCLHTGLSHSSWVASTYQRRILGSNRGAYSPHCGLMPVIFSRFRKATAIGSFNRACQGITGCSADEFETTSDTFLMSPAVIAIMKAQEPWQWMIALMVSAPVRSLTACTAFGMSSTAASSSVYATAGTSMLDRQLSSQTSKPLLDNTFSRFFVGGLNRLARLPVPPILNTGSLTVCSSGARCLRLRMRPSPAGDSWVSKRSNGIGSCTTCPSVDQGVDGGVDGGAAIAI